MGGDPYQLLGISPEASLEEARSAYRRLAALFHPDRLEGHREEVKEEAHRRMEELNAAWEEVRRRASGRPPSDRTEAVRPMVPDLPDDAEGGMVIGNAEVRHAGEQPRLHLRFGGDAAQAAALVLRRLSQGGVAAHEVDWGAFTATLDGTDTRRLLEEVVIARHPETVVEVLVPDDLGPLDLAAAVGRLEPAERYHLYAETFA